MNNVSFSDPEYTNKVPLSASDPSQLSVILALLAIPTITGALGGQLGLFLRLHPAVLRSECTHWAGTCLQLLFLFTINKINEVFLQYADRPFKILGFPCNQFLRQVAKWF